MKRYEEYYSETEALRRESMAQVSLEISTELAGEKIGSKAIMDYVLEAAIRMSSAALHWELEHYHNWLMEQLGEKQGETLDGTPISI